MTRSELLATMVLGPATPGFRGWIFQAAVHCHDCTLQIASSPSIVPKIAPIIDESDPLFQDSETIPQPVFFPESDHPVHCDSCNEYLYGSEEEDQ